MRFEEDLRSNKVKKDNWIKIYVISVKYLKDRYRRHNDEEDLDVTIKFYELFRKKYKFKLIFRRFWKVSRGFCF